ncbi:hypothetical protein [Anaerosolibacter carboniphilus]|uniref:hypothetical protein n=1 Tax=Anaerosolibacter carboniphilus TaxID=1417629 RepID=UPI001A9B488D|nr:hypothetical protein [Anaerosolibacter carboniphilus]
MYRGIYSIYKAFFFSLIPYQPPPPAIKAIGKRIEEGFDGRRVETDIDIKKLEVKAEPAGVFVM